MKNYNKFANIQALSSNENKEKSDLCYKEWLKKCHPKEEDLNVYRESHLIPNMDDYSYDQFREFITLRRKMLRERLYKFFVIKESD